jgi:putative peptide zinc metalloprotease protein
LIQLKNEQLDFELASAKASAVEVEARILQAREADTASLKPLRSRLDSVEKRIQRLERDRAALLIKARQDGVWVAPQIKDYRGRWLVRGTPLGLIIDPSAYEFTATVAQVDGDSLFRRQGLATQARLFGQSQRLLSLGPLTIVPAEQSTLPSPALGWAGGGELRLARDDQQGIHAAEPFFEVRAPVTASGDVTLLHGRAGKVRFDLPSEPLLPRWVRRLRQLLQKRYQL